MPRVLSVAAQELAHSSAVCGHSGSISGSQSTVSVLIVDDTLANLRLLSTILEQNDYTAYCAPSGAMSLIAAKHLQPDLILLDVNMPGMNGYETCRRLKESKETRDIPVMFISAFNGVLDKVTAFSVGAVDYVTKPFQAEEILARVANHVALRNLRQTLQDTNDELEKRVRERTAALTELNAAYEHFVPREFLEVLGKESIVDVQRGDQVSETMTVMFADIRSFTMLSEQMTPRKNFRFINEYLSYVSPPIKKHGGIIDKYIGDAIMALFPTTVHSSVEAAFDMQNALLTFNHERKKRGEAAIDIGISVHTGTMMLGIIGDEQRMQGTVISDAVNVAARLERLTKLYGAPIVTSVQTLMGLENLDSYHYRFLDKVHVKGKKEPLSVFELLNVEHDASARLKLETKTSFEEALFLYRSGKLYEAKEGFQYVCAINPDDKAARFYLNGVEMALNERRDVDAQPQFQSFQRRQPVYSDGFTQF